MRHRRQHKSTDWQKIVQTVKRSVPVMAFIAGLCAGAVILGATFLLEGAGSSARASVDPLPSDHVMALATDPSRIVIASGKAALADAPPRMVFSSITLPAPPVQYAKPQMHTAAPVILASGKADMMPQMLGIVTGAIPGAMPDTVRDTRPAIALVIDDLGVVPDRSAHALGLPNEVTLSFLPYGMVTRPLAQAAAAKGHEIFVHVPMEPLGDEDPGPEALMTRDSDRSLRAKLDTQLNGLMSLVPVAGLNNHMGSRATADRRVMNEVMRGAAERGLIYVDSVTTPGSKARASAAAHDVQFIARDIFLDHGQGADYLLAQLDTLEQSARAQGVAVAIAHPHETTLEVLSVWVKGLERKGLRLVPVSEAIDIESRQRMLAMLR